MTFLLTLLIVSLWMLLAGFCAVRFVDCAYAGQSLYAGCYALFLVISIAAMVVFAEAVSRHDPHSVDAQASARHSNSVGGSR